ncbi:hypothetical protein DERP_008247 [Dermatophagoides pteronyssinus]|uniref:Uncharacterized protein n=1 Tax=Dermatophagoides pteronyssinus TaxID=6956 RepID=A0ABQ8J645_DERPT|nr:hypothetical protein DERP_008247 [Dermatophagoides pteronyssinus]
MEMFRSGCLYPCLSNMQWKNKNDNNLNTKLKYNDDFSLFCSENFFLLASNNKKKSGRPR